MNEPTMTGRPTVSVVVPNYNYAKTLGACLDAVLAQTYPPAEIVVVDDGSSDDSVRIAESYPCTVVSTPNRGVSAARNLGVLKSSGDIVFFLDSDIALRPDALQRAVAALESDPGLGFVCGVYDDVPLFDDGPVERYKVLHGHYWRVRAAGPVHAAFFSLGAVRRSVFEAAGPLDETLRATEDVEYGARLAPFSRIELRADIVGRHDDDDRLGILLRKQFTRSVPLVSLFAERGRGRPKLAETAYRPAAVALLCLSAAGFAAAMLPGAPSQALVVLGGAGLLGYTVVERRLLNFARRRAGLRFLPVFYGLHALMNLTTGAAAAVGGVRWLLSADFRRLYAGSPKPLTQMPGGPADA
ncbi:glycosyltransferase family 2 protein [Streptomyces sp. NPDC012751]|uniref:glycosyltransferase family 2 protein n=1 Tax=Streptomyces sp. NPDC012751 TaxID=3364846 RepID=UPI003684E6DB